MPRARSAGVLLDSVPGRAVPIAAFDHALANGLCFCSAIMGTDLRHIDNLSMVYAVGSQADPGGIVRRMTEDLAQLGLGVFAVNHEFMNSQYEISLRHADALTAADRAFLLEASVKDIGAQHRLVATFMGKSFNDQGGSRPRTCTSREIIDTFLAVKRFEVGRHRAWVSDWGLDEYLHHL